MGRSRCITVILNFKPLIDLFGITITFIKRGASTLYKGDYVPGTEAAATTFKGVLQPLTERDMIFLMNAGVPLEGAKNLWIKDGDVNLTFQDELEDAAGDRWKVVTEDKNWSLQSKTKKYTVVKIA